MTVAGTYHEKALKFGGHLISSIDVVAGTSSVIFSSAVFSATYDAYMFEFTDVSPTSPTTHFALQISLDGTSYPASNLAWQRQLLDANGGAGLVGSVRHGLQYLWHLADHVLVPYGLSGWVKVTKRSTHSGVTPFTWKLSYSSSATSAAQTFSRGGGGSVAGPMAAMGFYFNGGTFSRGLIRQYGLTT